MSGSQSVYIQRMCQLNKDQSSKEESVQLETEPLASVGRVTRTKGTIEDEMGASRLYLQKSTCGL